MIETFEDRGGFLKPIVSPIIAIAKGFTYLAEFCKVLLGIFINIIELIPQVFSPDKLINDIIYGISAGLGTMFKAFFGGFNRRPKKSDNDMEGGKHLFGSSKKTKVVCIKPTTMTLLMLILCPPLALLLTEGIKSWYLVIICGLMTYYLYYIPGFIFAALHILC
mgnify:CR=1 FL=1